MQEEVVKKETRVRSAIVSGIDHSKINSRRELLGMSYAYLADRAEISQARMSTLSRGLSKWRVTDIRNVLDILDMEPRDVIQDPVILKYYLRELQLVEEANKQHG